MGLVMWSRHNTRVRWVTSAQISSTTCSADSTGKGTRARRTRAPARSQAKVQVRSMAP